MIKALSRLLKLKKLEARVRFHRLRFERNARGILHSGAYLDAHLSDARSRLDQLGPSIGIALVSPLPPADTGVAHFSARLAIECPGFIDLFATFDSPADYYDTLARIDQAAELFPLEVLSPAARRRQYNMVVFAIANSNHMPPIAERLRSFQRPKAALEVVAEVHDPVLFNLSRKTFSTEREMDAAYKAAYPRLGNRPFSQTEDSVLLDLGICGFAALFRNHVDRIVVHSEAAREILAEDFSEVPSPPIVKLFHPVFRQPERRNSLEGLKIRHPAMGSFGVPTNGKYSDEILAAARALLKTGAIKTFVMAGFGVAQVAEKLDASETDQILLVDSPSDEDLIRLMKEIDVAVQLRRRNLGESSGVIAQLMELKKPIVASNLGSFAEYGGLVTFCDVPVTPRSIGRAVTEALATAAERLPKMARYVETHRSMDFIAALCRGYEPSEDGNAVVEAAQRDRSLVNVFGFYDHYNAGDDAFKLYFKNVLGSRARFHGGSWKGRRIPGRIILGGGAVINDYFFDRLPDSDRLDIIGCSFSDRRQGAEQLASIRDRLGIVALRSAEDTAHAVSHGIPAETYPDIVFGLDAPRPSLSIAQVRALAPLPTLSGIADRTVVFCLSDHYSVRNLERMERYRTITRFKDEMAGALDVLARSFNIVMVPMSAGYNARDAAFSHDVLARMRGPEKVTLIERYLGPEGIMQLIASVADVVVSMKFHGLVFGMISGKPVINIGNTNKTIDLMAEADLLRFNLPVETLTGDALIEAVKSAPDSTARIEELRKTYKDRLSALTARLDRAYPAA